MTRPGSAAQAVRLSVIIPTLNEAENLPSLLERLTKALAGWSGAYEILIMDDGSTDDTVAAATALRARYPAVQVIQRAGREPGLSPSVVEGWTRARGELLAVMDADLQHPPETLPELVRAAEQGADVVVASRYSGHGQPLRWNWLRKRVSLSALHLAQAVLPPRAHAVTDPMSGYFLLRRDAIHGIDLQVKGYKILLEVLGRGRYRSVAEVPFTFGRRFKGRSKLSGRVMRDYLVQLWHLILAPRGWGRFVRYCFVGGSGVAVNMGVLWWLKEHGSLGTLRAAVVGVECAIINNFLWNELWTFRDRAALQPRLRDRVRRLVNFNIICGVGALLQIGFLWALAIHWHWHYLVANFLAIVVVTLWNYGFNLEWTWTATPGADAVSPEEDAERLWRWRWWVTAGILAAALGVRVWRLGAKSFWLDEASSWMFAQQPLATILLNTDETNPPLYYAMLHGWMALVGDSEAALRWLSVLWGMAAVILTGWIGRLLGGSLLGWVAMALMAVLPMPVEHSQTARTYALFLATSIASYGSLVQWERSRRRHWAAAYIFTTAVSSFAHNYWVFNVAAQQLYLVARVASRRVPLRDWVPLTVLTAVACLPWGSVLASQAVDAHRQVLWIPVPGWDDLVKAVRQQMAFQRSVLFAGGYLLFAAIGAASRRGPAAPYRGLLLLSWLCPTVLPFLLSLVGTPIFWPRYTIAGIAGLYLLTARGLLVVAARWRQVAMAAGVLMLLVSGLGLHRMYNWQREDWRTLVAEAKQRVSPDDAFILMCTRTDPFDYYARGAVPVSYPFDRVPARVDTLAERTELMRRVTEIIEGKRRVWVAVRTGSAGSHELVDRVVLHRYPGAREHYRRRLSQSLHLYSYDTAPST